MRPALLVAALGYFVDIFDIWLYSVYRVASLTDLGLSGEALTEQSTRILNAQMIGMAVGGLIFGVLGDRLGRKAALFGSILIYATATLFNAFVWNVESYLLARAVAGFGLAGELGAGVVLTMEVMKKEQRGYAPAIIAGFGLLGCVAAALIGDFVSWRAGYAIGGVMGFMLFFFRLKVGESTLFTVSLNSGIRRGSLLDLVAKPARLWRYVLCVLSGMPVWYIFGILLIFAPEFGAALGVQGKVVPAHAILYGSLAMAAGDVSSGLLSQKLRSRRFAMLLFLCGLMTANLIYFLSRGLSLTEFYALYAAMGFCVGYWAVMMAMVTEQFGTNLRATAATTVPNFVRGSVVVMTLSLGLLKPIYGLVPATMMLGGAVLAIAVIAILLLPETFYRDLDYYET